MELAVGLECISLPLYIARFTPRTFKSYPYKHNALTRSYACAWNIHSPSSHLDGHSKTISSSIAIVPAKSIIFKCLMRLCNIRKAINIWIILCLVLYAQLAALCWTLQDPLSSLHLQHVLPTSSTLSMYEKYQRPADPLQSWIWQIPAWHSEMLHAFMNTSLLATWVHIFYVSTMSPWQYHVTLIHQNMVYRGVTVCLLQLLPNIFIFKSHLDLYCWATV